MLGKQAKVLSPADVADLLTFADCTRNPIRNRVIVLLSAKAGMRACEIANLTWDMEVRAARSAMSSSFVITRQRRAAVG
jgi:integrase